MPKRLPSSLKRSLAEAVVNCSCLAFLCGSTTAQVPSPVERHDLPYLGQPPLRAAVPETKRSLAASMPATGLQLNTTSRRASRNFFNAVYMASEGVAPSWTGNVTTGDAGTTSAGFQSAVLLRLNALRAFAGVPANVRWNAVFSAKAQKAALMMSANGQLDHFPPSSWRFFSADGAEAAAKSNLYLGVFGPEAMTGYVEDPGSSNADVGHRRWLLYPPTQEMGTGDIPATADPAANALWVFDSPRSYPATREEFVAWPPPGYVPYSLIFPRWSFSLKDADLSSASVVVTRAGAPVATTIVSCLSGYGDNSLVWTLAEADDGSAFARPSQDLPHTVTISNVITNGATRSFTYSVIAMDPSVEGVDHIVPSLSGPQTGSRNATVSYTFPLIPEANKYELLRMKLGDASWIEGAEMESARIQFATTGGYEVRAISGLGTGAQIFHLSQEGFNDQIINLTPMFVADASSAIRFRTRYGFMTPSQTAAVEVSLDDGSSWRRIFARPGNTAISNFATETVSLSAFAGRSIRVRFVLDFSSGSAFTQVGDPDVGWSIDDVEPLSLKEATLVDTIASLGSPVNTILPAVLGEYVFATRGVLSDAFPLETGPLLRVTVTPTPTPTPTLTPTPTPVVISRPAPAPAPDPRLDQLASLEKQLLDARRIKNPKARASRMRLLNSQISSLKTEIAGGGSGGGSANSELAALQKQLADAKRIKNPKIRAKKIAEINAKIAAL